MSLASRMMDNPSTIESLTQLMRSANDAILTVYDSATLHVDTKSDSSPVTEADLAAHRVLVSGLNQIDQTIPIVSEEDPASLAISQSHSTYWLIDPLDGTKEFIKRNGEFTCNLALIEQNRPTLGFVSVPADGRVFFGGKALGAFVSTSAQDSRPIRCHRPISPLRVVASKSHLSPETSEYLDQLQTELTMVSVGSSLKFLLLAEGKADLYPRLGPTCEWDTAAAHAVLEGAGGSIKQLDDSPLTYGKDNILNPWFIARGIVYDHDAEHITRR